MGQRSKNSREALCPIPGIGSLSLVFVFSLFSNACTQLGLDPHSETEEVGDGAAADEGVIATGKFQANGKQTFVLEAPADSNLLGTSLSIEPGTFAVDATISIEEAGSLSSALSAASFGVAFDSSAGAAVSLDNDAGITELPPTSPPMTLQIPVFPGNNLHLAGDTVLAVLFRQSGDAGNCEEELIPPSKLSVKALSVELKTRKFGAFQALYVSKTDLDKKLSESEDGRIVITRPGCRVITISEIKKLPEFKISDLSIQRRDRVLGFSTTVQGEKVSACYLNLLVSGQENAIEKQSNLSSFNHDFSSVYEAISGKAQISCLSESSQEASTEHESFSLSASPHSLTLEKATSLGWLEGGSSYSYTIHPTWTKSSSSYVSHQKLKVFTDASCTVEQGSVLGDLAASVVSEAITVTENGSYYFKVSTVDTIGREVWSDCSTGLDVSYLTIPADPSDLELSNLSNAVDVAWNSGEVDTQGFIVARSTSPISFEPTQGESYSVGSNQIVYKGNETSFVDISLSIDTMYYYKVWAYSSENGYSDSLSNDIFVRAYNHRWRLHIDSSATAGSIKIEELKLRINGEFYSGSGVSSSSSGTIGGWQVVSIGGSSEISGSEAWKAFDGNNGDANLWESASDSFSSSSPFDGSAWIEVEFSEPVYIDGFSHFSPVDSCPDSYFLQYHNGSTWVTLPNSAKINTSCGTWKYEHAFQAYEASFLHTNVVYEDKTGESGVAEKTSLCVSGRLKGIHYFAGWAFDSIRAICSDEVTTDLIKKDDSTNNPRSEWSCPGGINDFVTKIELWTNGYGQSIEKVRLTCAEGGVSDTFGDWPNGNGTLEAAQTCSRPDQIPIGLSGMVDPYIQSLGLVCGDRPWVYPASCKEILDGGYGSADGIYTVDPDGLTGSISPFKVYCDMNGGGWTLIASSTTSSVGTNNTVAELLSTDHAGILSQQKVVALANVSDDVKIDGSGKSVNSTNTQPILRLREFKSLSISTSGDANWTGQNSNSYMYHSCPGDYSSLNLAVYHACGNGGGLHWIGGSGLHKWVHSSGSNENLNLWVK